MKLSILLLLTLPLGFVLKAQQTPEARLRAALQTKTGAATLPGGTIEISREIVLPADAHDLEIRGANTIVKAAATFRGRALIVLPAGKNIKLHDLQLDGNREAFAQPVPAPQPAAMLSRSVANNGLIAEGVTGLELSQIKATQFPGFPILINGGSKVRVHDVELTESGTLDANGHNNGTGGLVLEEGVTDFEITHDLIGKIRGNGIWIRATSGAGAPASGRITNNEFAILARAAVEMNHATGVVIENNTGHMIGFPGEEVLTGGTALPAAIATTGAVEHATIHNNNFDQIAGRCLSLDGFSNGEVTGNTCSEGLFNGILIRGAANHISGNRLTGLNHAQRDQPESLRAGIYLAAGATGNTIDSNEISGYGMGQHCVAGPGLDGNKVATNACSDGTSVARLLPGLPRATPR